jgi:hypothetical protein
MMPIIKQAPSNGLEPYFDESSTAWPSTEYMKEFYKTHSAAKLMEKDKLDVLDAAMLKLIFVPSTWIRAFLEPIPPKLAYERALWMKHLLPKNYTHLNQIKMILHWTRCTCVKGHGRENPNSQLMVPWRELLDDTYVRQCAEKRLADMYPRDFPTTHPKRC